MKRSSAIIKIFGLKVAEYFSIDTRPLCSCGSLSSARLAANDEVVPMALAVNLSNAAEILRDFIEMQPGGLEVIWVGDRKTKVVDTPHYQTACRIISDFDVYIKAKQS